MAVLERACVIALAGVLVGGAHSALTRSPISLKPAEPPPLILPAGSGAGVTSGGGAESVASTPASTERAAQAQQPAALGLEISSDAAKQLFDAGFTFVDARSREEYEAGHIENALWLPAELFYKGSGAPEALAFLDATKPIIIYCGGGACDASHNTARLLQQAGFPRTHVYVDGYGAWTQLQYPTASGAPWYESPG